MGGTPRGKDKPGPSYEDGELRDPEIEELRQPTDAQQLIRLIRRAVGQPRQVR